jgi:tRNA (guanine37-N1)-methyltransferase
MVMDEREIKFSRIRYDIVGDIAIIKIPRWNDGKIGVLIANHILSKCKGVKVVVTQTEPAHGEYRIQKFRVIAGENRTETIHKESKCFFKLDINKVFFTPRLMYERIRIARLVNYGEIIINMFAGVGTYSIIIARHAKPSAVYSIDTNPDAYNYMLQNIEINKVTNTIIPMLGDAKEIIMKKLVNIADRVLMPLPKLAKTYLPYAILALKNNGGYLHVYDVYRRNKGETTSDVFNKAIGDYTKILNDKVRNFEFKLIRVSRKIGVRLYQIVMDIYIVK